jgi:hypothetical protein
MPLMDRHERELRAGTLERLETPLKLNPLTAPTKANPMHAILDAMMRKLVRRSRCSTVLLMTPLRFFLGGGYKF